MSKRHDHNGHCSRSRGMSQFLPEPIVSSLRRSLENILETSTRGGYVIMTILISYWGAQPVCGARSLCHPTTVWQQVYGGQQADFLYVVRQTFDGGYIFGGETFSVLDGSETNNSSMPDLNLWIIRADDEGQALWSRSFGEQSFDHFVALEQMSDDGFVVAGNTEGNQRREFFLSRLDSLGNVITHSYYQFTNGVVLSLRETRDGGFILRGIAEDRFGRLDYWVTRLDAAGRVLWTRIFGGDGSDLLGEIQETSDGGFLLVGWSDSDVSGNKTIPARGGVDGWIIRLDAQGNRLWEQVYGSTGDDFLNFVIGVSNGYVLVGSSFSFPDEHKTSPALGEGDIWLAGIDEYGIQLWDRSYGGSGVDLVHALSRTGDGGIILGGLSQSHDGDRTTQDFGGELDVWVLRLDATFNRQWDLTFGGSHWDVLYDLQQTADGGFILGCASASPADGNKTVPSIGSWDYWVIKLGPEPICDNDNDGVPDDRDLCPNTPSGVIVNSDGCSIDQLVPCNGPWKNHGQYIAAVANVTSQFVRARLISSRESARIIAAAARSNCGR
jgi:hypothetical protein